MQQCSARYVVALLPPDGKVRLPHAGTVGSGQAHLAAGRRIWQQPGCKRCSQGARDVHIDVHRVQEMFTSMFTGCKRCSQGARDVHRDVHMCKAVRLRPSADAGPRP
eukprot:366152-Chlamydomonas_euryale.AAC.4